MKRIIPCFFVLIVCFTFLVSPVSAATFESGVEKSNQSFNILDYSTLNDTGSNLIVSPPGGVTFTYSNPFPCIISYVDILISFIGDVNPGHIFVSRGPGYALNDLTLVNVSGNLWRAYGYVAEYYDEFHISLANTSKAFVTVHSLKVFPVYNLKPIPISLAFNLHTANGTENYTLNSNGALNFSFPSVSQEQNYNGSFSVNLSLSDWKRYDYIDFLFGGDIDSFTSVDARIGNTLVPISYSLIADTEEDTNRHNVSVSVDLSSINRSLITGDFVVTISGHYSADVSRAGYVVYSRGYVDINDLNPLLSFWYNLKSFFTNNFNTLFSKLDEIFGLNDNAVSDAQQTQEEINVSVNNQLVGAVEDWNTHIEVVETGYDMAFSKTTPGLTWLASLADGIFNGMGWFGNVYFLIGLISVIMLVLSKSGLARSVGRIRRND